MVVSGRARPACTSGWLHPPVNASDVYGSSLWQGLRSSVLEAWAGSSLSSYSSAWNAFVGFCSDRQPPLSPLPASEATVGLYLFHRLGPARSFAVIKTASAAIAQMHTANNLPSPCGGLLPRLVRKVARRRLGEDVRNVKAPFRWVDLRDFAVHSCTVGQPAVRWIIALLAAISFAGFARPSEPTLLQWKHVEFSSSHVTLTFPRRKNRVYRESKVRIAFTGRIGCPTGLLRTWCSLRGGGRATEDFVFPGFDGRAVQRGAEASACLHPRPITYGQFRHYLSKWLAPRLNLTQQAFLEKFGMKSGRSGGASAAAGANIPFEVWGAQGGWQSREAQLRYMEIDLEQALSVSRAVLEGAVPETQVDGEASDSSDSE